MPGKLHPENLARNGVYSWRIHNGRKFGKRFGSKGGKARWASMSQEERDLVHAKARHTKQQNSRMNARLSKLSLRVPKTMSNDELEELEDFFGDII